MIAPDITTYIASVLCNALVDFMILCLDSSLSASNTPQMPAEHDEHCNANNNGEHVGEDIS
jgi:hypothetical protein